MSFQKNNYHGNEEHIKQHINKLRKENDSYVTRLLFMIRIHLSQTRKERASSFTSKGSISLEAALSVSFFFFAILSMIYLFEMMAIQTNIRSALHSVSKEVALESYVNPMIPTTRMEQRIAELVGEKRLNDSFVVHGCSGLDCSASKKYWNTTIMDLSVRYDIKIPVSIFRLPTISKEEVIRVKGWTGYEVKLTDPIENTMVYVTEYGMVYHADMYCNYLELSIRAVEKTALAELRNKSGATYKECLSCKYDGGSSKVYIADYGDKYHNSLECRGLKRNIYAISFSDVHGLGGCSKCVK